MQITVVGAGIVGISTAYALAQEGHQVTLVERNPGPGEGTSYANGGQLSYSYVAPLAGPGVLSHVPGWLLRRDSPLRLKPSLDPALLRWGLRFIAACNRERADRTTRELLALSFYSRARMEALRAASPDLSFSFARRGKLVVYRDAAAFASARAQVGYQATLGCEQHALSADETIAREPALAGARGAIVGAIYTPDEDVADCHQLCVGLFNRLCALPNVALRFNTGVESLWVEGRRVRGVRTAHEPIAADAVVVATGVASAGLLGPLRIDPGLYPLKGYSISLPLGRAGRAAMAHRSSASRTRRARSSTPASAARCAWRAWRTWWAGRTGSTRAACRPSTTKPARCFPPRCAPAMPAPMPRRGRACGRRPRPACRWWARRRWTACGSMSAMARWALRWPWAAPACWPT